MKIFTGVVENTKNAKTASVMVERVFVHPLYKKRLKRTKKYMVHDEFGAEVGDIVHFVATKPVSKMKKWVIVKVEEKKAEGKEK
ncbi:MAG TPA: 30S ribosomal protein S17 [Patescibacteria group bacterium]